MVVLRITGPAQQAGLEVVRGNQGDQADPERVSQAEVVVIQRDFPRFREAYAQVVARAQAEGKPVVYELDDLLLEMPPDHAARRDYAGFTFPMLRAVIEADLVTASSPRLCEYLRVFNPEVRLLPNYLNEKLWSFRSQDQNSSPESALVLGYMGGETHAADLAAVAPALLNVLERHNGQVILRIWGGKPPEALLASPRVDWVEINEHDYSRFAAFFAPQKCDLFVAPLEDNLFNRCKSAIKFLEYSVSAVPGVYSDLPPYQLAVQHGVNGFLAAGLDDWERRLNELIESPALRAELGRQAQQTVRKHWPLSEHAHEWPQVYRRAMDRSTIKQKQLPETLEVFMQIARQAEQHQWELEGLLEQRNQELASYDARLAAVSGQLQDIQSSRSWRLLQRFQQLRLALAPPGSRRERLLQRRGR